MDKREARDKLCDVIYWFRFAVRLLVYLPIALILLVLGVIVAIMDDLFWR